MIVIAYIAYAANNFLALVYLNYKVCCMKKRSKDFDT